MDGASIFTVFVCIIGAMHLFSRVGRSFQGKDAKIGAVKREKLGKQEQDDWYVFFHCSDLTGQRQGKSAENKQIIPRARSPRQRPQMRMQARI